MHIAFAGGGTAGHVTPALSIANAIKIQRPNTEITFFTSPSGIEREILKSYPYRTIELSIHNLSRNLSWKTVRTAVEVPLSILQAKRALAKCHIDLVIGTGGYVSYPAVIAAQLLGIQNFIHESNSIPGLVTKLLAKRSDGVLTNFSSCKDHLSQGTKVYQIGNFILSEKQVKPSFVLKESLGMKRGEKLVLIIGGSLGAMSINEMILKMVAKYKSKCDSLHFLISTGRANYNNVLQKANGIFGQLPQNIHLFPYVSPIADFLRSADIAITRAGACTLSELCYYHVPAIVIPYPKAAKDHQKYNALAYEKAGCGRIVMENELSEEMLLEALECLLFSPLKRDEIIHHQRSSFPVNRYDALFRLLSI